MKRDKRYKEMGEIMKDDFCTLYILAPNSDVYLEWSELEGAFCILNGYDRKIIKRYQLFESGINYLLENC